MENLSNFNSMNSKDFLLISSEEKDALPSEVRIEIASEALFDYVRYKKAYGKTIMVQELKQEFISIINCLNSQEQQVALERAYYKIDCLHVIS